jgi:hypothetical protein
MLRRLWVWLTRDLGPLCPYCRQPVDRCVCAWWMRL